MDTFMLWMYLAITCYYSNIKLCCNGSKYSGKSKEKGNIKFWIQLSKIYIFGIIVQSYQYIYVFP